tara:strand:+ start:565 stop:726 length:162 start_codon:yes stop_codon:yes gene_type:complete
MLINSKNSKRFREDMRTLSNYSIEKRRTHIKQDEQKRQTSKPPRKFPDPNSTL